MIKIRDMAERYGLSEGAMRDGCIRLGIHTRRDESLSDNQIERIDAWRRAVSLFRTATGLDDMTETDAQLTARTLFRYDAGILYWRFDQGARIREGRVAGCAGHKGYWRIKIHAKNYERGRLVWLMHRGRWPASALTRIDRDPQNDRIDNLREAAQYLPRLSDLAADRGVTTRKFLRDCRALDIEPLRIQSVYHLTDHQLHHLEKNEA